MDKIDAGNGRHVQATSGLKAEKHMQGSLFRCLVQNAHVKAWRGLSCLVGTQQNPFCTAAAPGPFL